MPKVKGATHVSSTFGDPKIMQSRVMSWPSRVATQSRIFIAMKICLFK